MEEHKYCLSLKMSQVKDRLVMDDEMANIYKMNVEKKPYDFNKNVTWRKD